MQTNLGFMPPVMADGPEECLLDQSFRALRPIALVFHVLRTAAPLLLSTRRLSLECAATAKTLLTLTKRIAPPELMSRDCPCSIAPRRARHRLEQLPPCWLAFRYDMLRLWESGRGQLETS